MAITKFPSISCGETYGNIVEDMQQYTDLYWLNKLVQDTLHAKHEKHYNILHSFLLYAAIKLEV